MKSKIIPEPGRIRQVPEHFSWIDHRIVRNARLEGCSFCSWALYLFLVTVADREGLSYYSKKSVCKHLSMDATELEQAIKQLIARELIALRSPFFQVLEVGNAFMKGGRDD